MLLRLHHDQSSRTFYTGMTNNLRRRERAQAENLFRGSRLNTTSPAWFISKHSNTSAMPLSERSRSRRGLALSGWRWLNRRIRSGMICRQSGISRRHSGFRRESPEQRAVSAQAKTQIPRFARNDNSFEYCHEDTPSYRRHCHSLSRPHRILCDSVKPSREDD